MPLDPDDPADVAAVDRNLQFFIGWFAHPVLVNGDYPEVMKTTIASKSSGPSRLPAFTEAEKRLIKGDSNLFFLSWTLPCLRRVNIVIKFTYTTHMF